MPHSNKTKILLYKKGVIKGLCPIFTKVCTQKAATTTTFNVCPNKSFKKKILKSNNIVS